jgi:hypothetical protein
MQNAYMDQVPRLEQFKGEHPEITIRTPLDSGSGAWSAARDGVVLTVQYDLRRLLDKLEWMQRSAL